MKLTTLRQEADLVNTPTSQDIDVVAQLGPSINKHLSGLKSLCKLIPDSKSVTDKIADLETEIAKQIKLQSNILEKNITVDDICEMFSRFKESHGDAAWVLISKQLKANGYQHNTIKSLIDESIIKLSK